MKFHLIHILSFLLLISCNTKEKQKTTNSTTEKETLREFVFKVNFKTSKRDEFIVLMNDVKVDEFQTKNIHIMEEVSPSQGYESITAAFGQENMSKNISLNLGKNLEKEVSIESINLKYGTKTFQLNTDKILKHFAFNRFVTFDSIKKVFYTKKNNGQHFPVLKLKQDIINRLIKDQL